MTCRIPFLKGQVNPLLIAPALEKYPPFPEASLLNFIPNVRGAGVCWSRSYDI